MNRVLASVVVLACSSVLGACGGSSGLDVLQALPIASADFDGAVLERATSTDSGSTLGKPNRATVTRLFRAEDGATDDLLETMVRSVRDQGWDLEESHIDGVFTVDRTVGSERISLSVKSTDEGLVRLRLLHLGTDVPDS